MNNLRIGTHNINGIRVNPGKIELLIDWMNEMNIDIMGLNETNINKKEGSFIIDKGSGYKGIWSCCDKDKIKGSGVGILIKNKWEKHIAQIYSKSAYFMEVVLVFKHLKIIVIVVYFPPNDRDKQGEIYSSIKKRIQNNRGNTSRFIIMGDFNVDLVKHQSTCHTQKSMVQWQVVTWLRNNHFEEVHNKLHGNEEYITWHRGEAKSGIDYIWVSNSWRDQVYRSKVWCARHITGSDHDIVETSFYTNIKDESGTRTRERGKQNMRTIWLVDKATKENWEDYKQILERKITRNIEGTENRRHDQDGKSWIEHNWDIIQNCILSSAHVQSQKKRSKRKGCSSRRIEVN